MEISDEMVERAADAMWRDTNMNAAPKWDDESEAYYTHLACAALHVALGDVEPLAMPDYVRRVEVVAEPSTPYWNVYLYEWKENIDGGGWQLIDDHLDLRYRLSYMVESIEMVRDCDTQWDCYKDEGMPHEWIAYPENWDRDGYGPSPVAAIRAAVANATS